MKMGAKHPQLTTPAAVSFTKTSGTLPILRHDWKSEPPVPTATHGTKEALQITLLCSRRNVHLALVPGAVLANLDASEE